MPENGRFHYHLGRNWLELERLEEALDCFARSLELDPCQPDTYLVISRTLNLTRQYAQAQELLELGLQLMPDQPHLLNELTNLHLLRGQVSQAAERAEQVARQLPENPAAQANQANLLLAQGRVQEALELCQSQEKKSASLWMVQATALEELERLDEAAQAYECATRSEGSDWSAWNNWGLVLLRLGRDSQAGPVLEQAMALAPGRPEPVLNLALCWAREAESASQARQLLEELLTRPKLASGLREQAERLLTAIASSQTA